MKIKYIFYSFLISFSALAQSVIVPNPQVVVETSNSSNKTTIGAASCSGDSLANQYNANGKWFHPSINGFIQYFDVKATNAININDFYLSGFDGDTVDVYSIAGTWVGNDTSLSGWNFEGQAYLAISGDWLGLNMNISLASGQTRGFAFFTPGGNTGAVIISGNASNTAATTDSIQASNSDLMWFGNKIAVLPSFNAGTQYFNIWGEICYTTGPSCPPISKTIKPYGMHKFWVNQGASDPNTFYFGTTQWKRLRAIVSGGVGPYTYAWSSNTGTMKNQWGNQVYLFEPTMAPVITCVITDAGNGCTYTQTINLGWDTQYYCGNLSATGKDYWMITVCKGGVTMCVNHTIGKGWMKSGAATLGACGSSKTINLISTKDKESFILYPNPSNGLFNIDFDLEDYIDVSLTVTDLIGNVIMREELQTERDGYSKVLDMSSFNSGMYLLVVNINGETTAQRIQIIR